MPLIKDKFGSERRKAKVRWMGMGMGRSAADRGWGLSPFDCLPPNRLGPELQHCVR